jgi:uncharacterized protein (UPF0147 family)
MVFSTSSFLLVIIATIIYQAYYWYLLDTIRYPVVCCRLTDLMVSSRRCQVNQEAWDAVTRAMDTLKIVMADRTVCEGCRLAATKAFLELISARHALLVAHNKAALEEVSDGA